MKRIFNLPAVISAAVIICGCSNEEKITEKTFTVTGQFTNSQAKKVYLEEISITTLQRTAADSSVISSDGKFELKGNRYKDAVYALRLDRSEFPSLTVLNDTNIVTVKASFPDGGNGYLETYEVSGSPGSQQLKEYVTEFGNKLMKLYNADMRTDSLSKIVPADNNAINKLAEERRITAEGLKNTTIMAIEKSGNAALAMYLLGYYQVTGNQNPYFRLASISDDEIFSIVSQTAEKLPANKEVVQLKEQLEIERKKMLVGRAAPEIKMPDPSGKEIALSSFKGKYVLVDFWASWCRPCREENPNVVAAYQKFRNKNFTILGVSLDKNKEPWTKAIMKDGLTWTHISDLQEWSSPVVPLYNIAGIPFNVLVNPEGKVVAQNLRGEGLHEKLAEMLK